MRRTSAVVAVGLFSLAACGEVRETADQVASGADVVRDCAVLATDAAQVRLESLEQVDAQDVQQAAEQLGEDVATIDDAEVRAAAERLQEGLEQAAQAAREGDATALEDARQEVTDAFAEAAQACDVPVEEFTG
jgi:hypothetical protein